MAEKDIFEQIQESFRGLIEAGFSWRAITDAVNRHAGESEEWSQFKLDSTNFGPLMQGNKSRRPDNKRIQFFIDVFPLVNAELRSSKSEKLRPLKHMYYEHFKTKYEEILAAEEKQFKLPVPFFSRRYKVAEEDVPRFLSAFPLALQAFIDKRNYNPRWVSDLIEYSTKVPIGSTNQDSNSFRKLFSGDGSRDSFIGHALSPYSETLALFFDLGRYLRFCEVFHKEPLIYLTDVDWAMYNNAVIHLRETFGEKEIDTGNNLRRSSVFRRKLYKKLGQYFSKEGNTNDIYEERLLMDLASPIDTEIKMPLLELISDHYAELSSDLLSVCKLPDIKGENLKKFHSFFDDLKDVNYNYNLLSPAYMADSVKFLKYFFIRRDKIRIFKTIQTVLEHYKRLDKPTFLYTFAQRYIQHRYNHYIKLGVESEKRFDKSFFELDKADDFNVDISLHAVYFDQYHFTSSRENVQLEVIPYYFPSGKIWHTFPNDMARMKEQAILIFDHSDLEGRNKIKNIYKNLESHQLAIQMSDFFSFINYFFAKDEKFWLEFFSKVEVFNTEIVASWRSYQMAPHEKYDLFAEKLFSSFYDREELPYYFYPYLFASDARGDEQKETKLREFYSDLTPFVMERVVLELNTENWC
jgi:hypothetical protein